MRVDEDENLIIVAFKDIETKEVFGFADKAPLKGADLRKALAEIPEGCIVQNLVENTHNGDLVVVLKNDEELLFYYKFVREHAEKVVIKYTEIDLKTTNQYDSFETKCLDAEFATFTTSFGPNPFRLRETETSIIDSNLLSSFLETQTSSPGEGDTITLPADAVTGSKETNVVIRFNSFTKTPVNASRQTISDIIVNEVSSDFTKFKNNKGPLISKHYVAVKQSDQRWELRLIARPPYPYHEEFVKLFVFETEGIQTQLMRTIVSTQSPDIPLGLQEVYAAGMYNEITNIPSLAFALNSLIQDDALSIQCETISTGEEKDVFEIVMSFTDIGCSPLMMMMGLNINSNEDSNKYVPQAMLLLRTIVNISNSTAKTNLDETESGAKETLIIDKTVKAFSDLQSQLLAVQKTLNLKSTPKPESKKDYPRIGVIEGVAQDVVSMRLKTLLKFTLKVSVYTVEFDGSATGARGTRFAEFSDHDLRIGMQYFFFETVVPRKVGTNPAEPISFNFEKLNNGLKKPLLFAESFSFAYLDMSAIGSNELFKQLFDNSCVVPYPKVVAPENFNINYPSLTSASGILHLKSFQAGAIKFYLEELKKWANETNVQILMRVEPESDQAANIIIKVFSSPDYRFANLNASTLQEALNTKLVAIVNSQQ